MSGAAPKTVKVVVFQEGGRWVAQCLDFDLATSAERLEDLPRRVHSQLMGQIAADFRRGTEPFSAFQKAPERFWKMYSEGRTWRTERLRMPLLARLLGWLRDRRLPQKRLDLAWVAH